jgi:hypothetical protein
MGAKNILYTAMKPSIGGGGSGNPGRKHGVLIDASRKSSASPKKGGTAKESKNTSLCKG